MPKPKQPEHEEQGESAPLWIISFADLVTLMLSFFVILAAANPKDAQLDPEFAKIVAAMKAAFGNLPDSDQPVEAVQDFEALLKKLMALKASKKPPARGDTPDKGIPGDSFLVRRIRDGMEITMGGPVFFEPLSAKPTEEGEQQLQQIMQIVKGHRNIIEVRGHVGQMPWPQDWTYLDVLKLSYARAEFVGNVLLKNGIDPRAIRLVAAGPTEPAARETPDSATRAQNHRVEIIIRESLIDDYAGQVAPPPSAASRPAD